MKKTIINIFIMLSLLLAAVNYAREIKTFIFSARKKKKRSVND